ncbi:hypothetical protein CFOL_v3_12931 [Cephalotus follicularis]|uniref:Uncharacterized protein n=1 Tax=Cephalotus follicularis TaxID=3775 RepID=A0A1Q3BN35_CEPFO|nr:hypothetical protein CFOL_v3_12931 [Cephalotus follicularis]
MGSGLPLSSMKKIVQSRTSRASNSAVVRVLAENPLVLQGKEQESNRHERILLISVLKGKLQVQNREPLLNMQHRPLKEVLVERIRLPLFPKIQNGKKAPR